MNNLKQALRLLGVLTLAFVFFGTVSGSAQAALTFSATDIASDGAFTLTFEGATADAFETTFAVTDPTADRTITFPNETGTVVTTGSANVVTGMITDGTILAADFAAGAVDSAAILDNSVASGDILLDTIVAVDIATGGVGTLEILDASILAADFATGG